MPQDELAAKALDLTARAIDLLAVVGGLANTTGYAALVAKELGRWLGKEGMDENALQHFLSKSHALVMPNSDERVVKFFETATGACNRHSKSSQAPWRPLPFQSMAKFIASDPNQQWMTSTISCLFPYHDMESVKRFFCYFIILSGQKDGQDAWSKKLIDRMPEKSRLDPLVNKIVESTWLHVTNSCQHADGHPSLPDEFGWACKKGHNVDDFDLAMLLVKINQSTGREIIVQSMHLLSNEDEEKCRSGQDEEGKFKLFRVFEKISGNLKPLFKAPYMPQPTRLGNPSRQLLYIWPHSYETDAASIRQLTAHTARELLRWYLEIPLSKRPDGSHNNLICDIDAREECEVDDSRPRIGDLLGRSPRWLTMPQGGLKKRTAQVFAPKEANTGRRLKRTTTYDEDALDFDHWTIPRIMNYFPILQNLVAKLIHSCGCRSCSKLHSAPRKITLLEPDVVKIPSDRNCLVYRAFSEVMFLFSHGIADAFGADDASGTRSLAASLTEDLGALRILCEAIGRRGDGDGLIAWSTLFTTAVRVFLGNQMEELLADPEQENRLREEYPQRLRDAPLTPSDTARAVIAVQYGSLAVVAPWLDISKPLSYKQAFRFEILQGKLALDDGEGFAPGEVSIIWTPETENVSELGSRPVAELHEAGAVISPQLDELEEKWDWILVSLTPETAVLFLRVVCGKYSRMINPTNAFVQVISAVRAPACSHSLAPSHTVQQNCVAELQSFEELLGTWESESDRYKAENLSSDYEFDSDEEELHIANMLNAKDLDKLDQRFEEPILESTTPPLSPTHEAFRNRTRIRVSHILDSAFKFNTALALTPSEISPLILKGDCCLHCGMLYELEHDQRVRIDHPKVFYIINKAQESKVTNPLPFRDRRTINSSGVNKVTRLIGGASARET
ncbi:hypothetical protein QBC38DRAFT_425310 [Podospora fimiseda]|uniref:Uncharacterized protein n=1 Tax=Podospora fimiseda TaxID=252190 RepID=A0AAN7GP10_9PEZI|nr:hypothetical protein QBC38DRAFT_425310 [Podospora fimiseda]